jgi:hypothetical protein
MIVNLSTENIGWLGIGVGVGIFIGGVVMSHAQDRQQTPFEQALSAKLFQEINSSLSCAVTQLTVQRELDAAKARIKELEAQTAPK